MSSFFPTPAVDDAAAAPAAADDDVAAADDDDDNGFSALNPVSFPVPNPKSNHDRMACRVGLVAVGSSVTTKHSRVC